LGVAHDQGHRETSEATNWNVLQLPRKCWQNSVQGPWGFGTGKEAFRDCSGRGRIIAMS
jgi:hypothetical protein